MNEKNQDFPNGREAFFVVVALFAAEYLLGAAMYGMRAFLALPDEDVGSLVTLLANGIVFTAVMRLQMTKFDLACGTCLTQGPAKITRTLTGFQRCQCAACGKEHIFPLPMATKVSYYAMLGIVFLLMGTGKITGPGIIAVIAGYALYKDWEMGNKHPTGRLISRP